jgi:NAD(P)-dependent dehydrogenase (short-subunit alcohol dehydrogenase family)
MAQSLQGLTVLLTGATDGIGRLAAEALAREGAVLFVHGRNPQKLTDTVRSLNSLGAEAQGFVADLASLEQTVRLAREVIEAKRPLDVLINNAGVGFGRDGNLRQTSLDGHELRFAVNYLAPFLLTNELLAHGLPRRAVINVASIGQEPLDFGDLMTARDYSGVRGYRRSKLALVMWSFDLAERRPDIAVHVLHPGTLLGTNMVLEAGLPVQGPPSRGADAILAVLDAALAGGRSGLYFDEKRPARANEGAYDRSAWERLREASLKLTAPWRSAGDTPVEK